MTDIVTILEDLDGPITDEDRMAASLTIRLLRKEIARLQEVSVKNFQEGMR